MTEYLSMTHGSPTTKGNRMTDPEAVQKAKDIAGKAREIQGKLYIDDAPERHESLDKFLLGLLEDEYPELVKYIKRLKVWYG
jgi:hypothetical protein